MAREVDSDHQRADAAQYPMYLLEEGEQRILVGVFYAPHVGYGPEERSAFCQSLARAWKQECRSLPSAWKFLAGDANLPSKTCRLDPKVSQAATTRWLRCVCPCMRLSAPRPLCGGKWSMNRVGHAIGKTWSNHLQLGINGSIGPCRTYWTARETDSGVVR